MSERWVAFQSKAGQELGYAEDISPTLKAGGTRPTDHQSVKPVAIVKLMVAESDKPLSLFPSSAEGSRAKITALQESAAAWLATVAHSGGKCTGSLLTSSPPGLSERMYLGSFPQMEDATSSPSLPPLFNSGMAAPGLLLTLNTSEWRNGGGACSLSDILEASPDPKYLLSPKACSGILRRAERRGKTLPEALRQALARRAGERQGPENPEGKTR